MAKNVNYLYPIFLYAFDLRRGGGAGLNLKILIFLLELKHYHCAYSYTKIVHFIVNYYFTLSTNETRKSLPYNKDQEHSFGRMNAKNYEMPN